MRTLEAETEPNDMSVGSALAHEVVWPMWERLREDMMLQLDGITIDDLCRQASSKGIGVGADAAAEPTKVDA